MKLKCPKCEGTGGFIVRSQAVTIAMVEWNGDVWDTDVETKKQAKRAQCLDCDAQIRLDDDGVPIRVPPQEPKP